MDKPNPRGEQPDETVSPFVRIPKLIVLFLLGGFYFLFIAFVPMLCQSKRGFRGWYWKKVKRSCSRLLWLLSIKTEFSDAARVAMAKDENSIIVVNHRSHLDGFTLMDTFPDEKWYTFGAKKELCDSGLLRRGFTGAGLVEIDRESGKKALETLTDAVKNMPKRRSVVLFPEGTRARTETLGEFKAGAVLVARETGRLIRPVVIIGADDLLPRGKSMPKDGTVRVEVLPPFVCDLDGTADDDVKRLWSEMNDVFTGKTAGI